MKITIKWTVDSKSDEEAKKVEALLKNAHGTLLPPLPDWDPEELRNEIQDLKLENDRIEKQKEIMLHFIKSVRCKGMVCKNCDLHFLNSHGPDLCGQVDHVKLEASASNVLKKLEAL